MAVSRVQFIGDAAQLLQTYRSIGAAATVLDRQIGTLNKAALNLRGLQVNQGGIFGRRGLSFGPAISNVKSDFDAINNVIKTTGETFINLGRKGTFLTGTFTEIHGNVQAVTEAAGRMGTALTNLNNVANNTRGIRRQTTDTIRLLEAQKALGAFSTGRYAAGTVISGQKVGGRFAPAGFLTDANLAAEKIKYQQAQALVNAEKDLFRRARTDFDRAYASAPTTPPAGFSQIPPNVYRQIQRTQPQLASVNNPVGLYGQGARITQLTEDLIHGTTRAQLEFNKVNKDGTRTLVQGAVEWDRYGKAVTRFGGNLSGISNLLNQTVRNLQKVIQWTVATTVVFGSLAFAAKELGTLVDLDKNLQQLAITSQQTATQTREMFGSLADVAFETATPLQQLVKAADDIALATRNSGSSVQEYQRDILNLTRAVGIYTNLTGADTVQATDLLTSAMKQLGIQTEDVVGILSKITAVAGGQSNAIADITQVLAVMSEAARQAGLTIDETIGTAQVLSQVTAKSPAEIATAFKNLTGSLDSVAGSKALKKFGIDLRDEAGNLRNILDIYGEISDKIRQGVIPAADVKGLVKAIAGGPRRVPDAAALLSNIDTIQAATDRSIKATNDALIVNAKILDTTQAKLTQLQVTVDRFAFEKFGPALKQSVEVFLQAATGLVSVLNQIDTSLISTAIQVGAFFLAFKIGAGVLTRLLSPLAGLVTSFNAIRQASLGAAAGVEAFSLRAAARGALSGNLTKIGAGAVVGAGLTAAAGGTPGQILGGGLQGIGGTLLALGPDPFTKVAGGVAFLGGTLLQFATANQEAAAAQKDTNKALEDADAALNAFAAYKEARDNIEAMKSTQDDLSESIDTINSKHNQTAEDLALLRDSQAQYVENTLAMADANTKLSDSQNVLNQVVPGFQEAIKSAQQGLLSDEQLNAFLDKYQRELLKKTRPDLVLPEQISVPRPQDVGFLQYSTDEAQRRLQQQYGRQNAPGSGFEVRGLNLTPDFDLRELELVEGGFKRVKELFADNQFRNNIFVTGENLDLVSEALQKLKESGDPDADTLTKIFNAFKSGKDAIDGAEVNMAQYQARIQAISLIDPNKGGQLQKIADLTQKIITLGGQKGDAKAVFDSQNYLADLLDGTQKISQQGIINLAEQYGKLLGLISDTGQTYEIVGAKGQETLNVLNPQGVIDKNLVLQGILDNMGFTFEIIGAKGHESLQAISADAVELAGNVEDVSNKLLEGLASRSADLQARLQGGEFKGHMLDFTAENNQIQALISNIEQLKETTTNYLSGLNDDAFKVFSNDLAVFEESLVTIPGLQDAVGLSADQLIERMFGLAETYGLTGKQVDSLGEKLNTLFASFQQLNNIRAKFHLAADINVQDAIAKLKALRNATVALLGTAKNNPFIGPGTSGALNANSGVGALDAAIAQLQKIGGSFGGFDTIYGGGGGTSGAGGKAGKGSKASKGSKSGSGSTAQGPDVSTIDIPDAIATAYNRDALIQEAIRRAKALQGTIPGAAKEAKNDIVEILKGTQNILEVRGVKDDLLRKALEELADIEKKRLDFETKADTIRRIRIGSGTFAALANVPVNSTTGVSLGGAQGPINVTLNLNGTVLTPAQLSQFADLVASALKRQIANG